MKILDDLKGTLLVSCQAYPDEPLHGEMFMAKMALAAKIGGAKGLRGCGPLDIKAMKQEVDLPIVGINKKFTEGCEVIITPDIESEEEILKVGADIIAIDCTFRKNYKGVYSYDYIPEFKSKYPNVPVMADISTLEEGINAYKLGADIISTTLSGFTDYSPRQEEPDFKLIKDIRDALGDKVYINAEGRISTKEDVKKALLMGADFVTVGTAITRPQWITEQITKYIG